MIQNSQVPALGIKTHLLVIIALRTDNTLTLRPPPLSNDLSHPLAEREAPVTRDHDTTEYIDDLDGEGQDAVAALLDLQHDGLDVVLEEQAGDHALVDLLALLRDGVLVGEDGAACGGRPGTLVHAVDGGHDRHEVLELVEVRFGQVNGAIERVHERRVVLPKREL